MRQFSVGGNDKFADAAEFAAALDQQNGLPPCIVEGVVGNQQMVVPVQYRVYAVGGGHHRTAVERRVLAGAVAQMGEQDDIIRSPGANLVDALLQEFRQAAFSQVIVLHALFVIKGITLRVQRLRSGHPYPADALAAGLADVPGRKYGLLGSEAVEPEQIGADDRTTHKIVLPAKFHHTRHSIVEFVVAEGHDVITDLAHHLNRVGSFRERAHRPALDKIAGRGGEDIGGVRCRDGIAQTGKGGIPVQCAMDVVVVHNNNAFIVLRTGCGE